MPFQDKRVLWDWEFIQSLSDELACYELSDKQVNFLLGIVPQYEWSTRWANVGASTQDERSAFGADVINQLLVQSEDCSDSGNGSLGECFRLDTTSEVFDFYPNNPFDDEDQNFTVIQARWRRFSRLISEDDLPSWFQAILDFLEDNGGYFPNDCFISYSDQGIFRESEYENFFDFLSNYNVLPFPYVNWQMKGTGQFEIEFCQVPIGGACLLSWDIEFELQQIWDIVTGQAGDEGDNWRVFDLNRNVFGIPPELIPTIVQEIDFSEDGDHEVTALFYPALRATPPFFHPFGGIREIEVCGLTMVGVETGQDITKYNSGLEAHIRKGVIGAMATEDLCEALICAFEEISKRILYAEDRDNIVGGISVGKDGKVAIDAGIVKGSQVDGSNQELRYGGVYFQASQVAKLYADINGYIDSGYALSTIVQLTEKFVGINDITDPELHASWQAQITSYKTADPELVIDEDALALLLFCLDTNEAIIEYAQSEAANETELLFIVDIATLIPAATFTQWYSQGSLEPKLGFEGAPCFRYPVQTYALTVENFTGAFINWSTAGLTNRRIRIELDVIAPFVNAEGDIFDGYWYLEDGGSLNANYRMRAQNNSNFTFFPVNNQAYLNGSGRYVLEYEVDNIFTGTIFNNIHTSESFVPVSGAINMTAYDLGDKG